MVRLVKIILTLALTTLFSLVALNNEFTSRSKLEKSVSKPSEEIKPAYAKFMVTRSIDGDTVELSNGEIVRYIGINAPESVDPRVKVQCFSKEAARYNKDLVEGKEVYLETDVSNSDKYGRWLRYVYLDDPSSTTSARMVNEILVLNGYAASLTYPPDVKYVDRFLTAQKLASKARVGLWAHCPVVYR